MKTLIRVSAAALLLSVLVPTVLRADDSVTKAARVDFVVQPNFPTAARSLGLREGTVTILIAVDSEGKLVDWIAVSATNPAFVDAIGTTIDRWAFEPGYRDGKPVPYTLCETCRFLDKSNAITVDGTQMEKMLLNSQIGIKDAPLVAKIAELDHMPEPLKIVQPVLSADIPAGQRAGMVEMGFFIDPTGHVRMPYVIQCNGDIRLAYAAYAALTEWQFKPSTVRGEPMTVRASQKFFFHEPPIAAKSEASAKK
jgi:outer membrane biosynthesis protein TonB